MLQSYFKNLMHHAINFESHIVSKISIMQPFHRRRQFQKYAYCTEEKVRATINIHIDSDSITVISEMSQKHIHSDPQQLVFFRQ